MAYNGYWDFESDAAYVVASFSDFVGIYDLSNLSASAWANIRSDGGNLYVTDSIGTRWPAYVPWINTGTSEGYVVFLMPTLAAASNTVVHLHIDDTSVTAPAVGSTYGRNAVFGGMVAAYLFAEASGNIADLTGNGHDITITNGSYQAAGLFGPSLELVNGQGNVAATSYGVISHDTALNPATTSNISFDFVVLNNDDYTNSFPELSTVFEKGSSSHYYSFLLRGGTPAYNGFYGRMGNGTITNQDSNTDNRTAINANTWRHYVFTYNGTNGTVYFEGQNEGSTAMTAVSSTGDFQLARTITNRYPFDGKYQMLFIHSQTLSDSQVETIYNSRMDMGNFWTGGAWNPDSVAFVPRMFFMS